MKPILIMCEAGEITPAQIVKLNIAGFETCLKGGVFMARYDRPKCLNK